MHDEIVIAGALSGLVLGILVQSLIGGLLVGLGLSLRGAFRVGDRVRVGEHEGIVAAMDWRSTTLLTPAQSHLTLPNRFVADAAVVNYDRPSRRHRATVRVLVSAAARPNDAARILEECAAMIPSIFADPKPQAQHLGFENGVALYGVTVVVSDVDAEPEAADRLRRLAWYRLRRAGIDPVYAGPSPDRDPAARGPLSDLLARVPLLAALEPATVARLAEKATVELYGAGEHVFRQGDLGESLYVVRSGAVEIRAGVPGGAGETTLVETLRPGESEGARSLLTGAPRSAHATAAADTELIVIDRAGAEEVLLADRAAAERLVAAAREQMKGEEATPSEGDEGKSLLARIERFLSPG